MEYYTELEIFCDKNSLDAADGNGHVQSSLAKALSQIPKNVVDDVIKNCFFLISDPIESKPFYVSSKKINNRAVVYLSDEFWEKGIDQQIKAIIHESAHHVLKHELPDKKIIDAWETEASDLVTEWEKLYAEYKEKNG